MVKQERRLRVFENRVLRKIFGAKREEIGGDWRKLCNEELPHLYCSSDIFEAINQEVEVGRACGMYGGEER
jgi:hypothetical protein